MKRIHTISSAMLAAAMLLATACSEELMDGDHTAANAVQIATATVGGDTPAQSRAAIDATEFIAGDAITLSTDAAGSAKYTYTKSDNGWTLTTPLYWGNTYPVTYYAAYPTSSTYNAFTLPTTQSSLTALEAANYMTAKTDEISEKPTDGSISLTFAHRTAQVVVKINKQRTVGNDGTLSNARIYSPKSGYTNAAVSGTSTEVIPFTATGTIEDELEAQYTALVIPGAATNHTLFSIEVDGKGLTYTTTVNFEANKIYTYTLTIGTDRVALDGLTESEWTEKTATGTMHENWIDYAATGFAGGDGTETTPYLISTAEQLAYLAKTVYETSKQYYKLTDDIDLSGKLWTPIGYGGVAQHTGEYFAFKGNFDGDGKTISGLTILSTASDSRYSGLFGWVYTYASDFAPTIKNVHLTDVDVRGYGYVGALVGRVNSNNKDCLIMGCTAKGKVTGIGPWQKVTNDVFEPLITINENCVGGLIGSGYFMKSSLIYACAAEVEVTRSGSHDAFLGGLVGRVVEVGSVTLQIAACHVAKVPEGNAIIVGKSISSPGELKLKNCVTSHISTVWANGDLKSTEGCVSGITDLSEAKSALTATISDRINYNNNIYIPANVTWNENTDGKHCQLIPAAYTPSPYSPPTSIGTAEQLKELRDWVNEGNTCQGTSFTLTADIDLKDEENWTPIGNNQKQFRGNFDGQGHTISNLKISSTVSDVGLFGVVMENTIKNLTIKDAEVTVTGGYYAGILIGYTNTKITIDNCHVTGNSSVTAVGSQHVGGLIGYVSQNITMSRCSSNANVTADSYMGGLIGFISGGYNRNAEAKIYASYSTGDLKITASKDARAGGLIGYSNSLGATISGCYTTCTFSGNTTTTEYIGKLVGDVEGYESYPAKSIMSNCASTDNACRLVGFTNEYSTNTLTNCNGSTDATYTGSVTASGIYGIVTASSDASFTGGDGTTYNVKDCWTNNGGSAPTLKVKADGTTN